MKKTLLLVLTIIITSSAFSQQYSAEDYDTVVVRDLNLWNKIAFKAEIAKNLDAEASFGLRLKDDASFTDQYFGNLNLDYKLNKHFDFALNTGTVKIMMKKMDLKDIIVLVVSHVIKRNLTD